MTKKLFGIQPPKARSGCPVACVLDLLGDKWTLIVVRDLVLGKTRYQEFLRSPEKIPTNILAERLKRLESLEIVTREQYQDNPPRSEYRLTTKGTELQPVLKAMIDWAKKHLGEFPLLKEIPAIMARNKALKEK